MTISACVTENSESSTILKPRSIENFVQVIFWIICTRFVDAKKCTVSELLIFDIKAPKLFIFSIKAPKLFIFLIKVSVYLFIFIKASEMSNNLIVNLVMFIIDLEMFIIRNQ